MKNVLVLGATGLVGQAVFKYLFNKNPDHVFGTSRVASKSFFLLSAESFIDDIKNIDINMDYVVNCIGITNADANEDKLRLVNSEFPHLLEKYCEDNGINLIHISTDAVFSKNSGACDEIIKPNPETPYGKSKLAGETNSLNAVTIRSSFLGVDPISHNGLIEKFLLADEVSASSKHSWSGCTTIQFANFCEDVIEKFDQIRNKSKIIHFAPIGPISRYDIANSIKDVFNKDFKIIDEGEIVTRYLTSKYFDLTKLDSYNSNINFALSELIND